MSDIKGLISVDTKKDSHAVAVTVVGSLAPYALVGGFASKTTASAWLKSETGTLWASEMEREAGDEWYELTKEDAGVETCVVYINHHSNIGTGLALSLKEYE